MAGVRVAVAPGVVEQLGAQQMVAAAVREAQGLCALERAMSCAGTSGVVGMGCSSGSKVTSER